MNAHLAKLGDRLKIHYVCYDSTGQELESTISTEPPLIILGDGQILPALEAALVGLSAGQSRTVTLPPGQAFGEYQEDLVGYIPFEQLQLDGEEPQIGLPVAIADSQGEELLQAEITGVEELGVTVDGNHPLAGQTLKFQLTLVAIMS